MPFDRKVVSLEGSNTIDCTSATSTQVNLGNDSDGDASDHISTLMIPLEIPDRIRVHNSLHGLGPNNEILLVMHPHSASRGCMVRLLPTAWLDDDIVNFCVVAKAKRDFELKERNHCHFFTKLLGENGCKSSNAKRSSKTIESKNIFNVENNFFSISTENSHCACAVMHTYYKKIITMIAWMMMVVFASVGY